MYRKLRITCLVAILFLLVGIGIKGYNCSEQASASKRFHIKRIAYYGPLEPPKPYGPPIPPQPTPKEVEASKQTAKVVVASTSRGESPAIKFVATAYTYTGHGTATGTKTVPGRTIAVDPRLVPLGSRVYLKGGYWFHGKYRDVSGVYVAEDTGGAIHGYIIDFFLGTREECIAWGRRTVEIQILK